MIATDSEDELDRLAAKAAKAKRKVSRPETLIEFGISAHLCFVFDAAG